MPNEIMEQDMPFAQVTLAGQVKMLRFILKRRTATDYPDCHNSIPVDGGCNGRLPAMLCFVEEA